MLELHKDIDRLEEIDRAEAYLKYAKERGFLDAHIKSVLDR